MRPQNARHLRPRHLRFLDMLHHVIRENGVERFSGEGQRPIQVDDFIDVLCAVEGGAPIDADCFRDEITIHSIKWDLAATVVEQPTLGMLLQAGADTIRTQWSQTSAMLCEAHAGPVTASKGRSPRRTWTGAKPPHSSSQDAPATTSWVSFSSHIRQSA